MDDYQNALASLWVSLYPIHYLRAEDHFKIRFTPVAASAICQLFQACFIGEKFTGSSSPAARNSCRDQDHLAGALVSEASRSCALILDNLTHRSLCTDLPRA